MRVEFTNLIFFFSYISSITISKKIPLWFKNSQKNLEESKIKLLPDLILDRNETSIKKLSMDDFKTLMQIWATMFVFTFPIIVVPYKSDD